MHTVIQITLDTQPINTFFFSSTGPIFQSYFRLGWVPWDWVCSSRFL